MRNYSIKRSMDKEFIKEKDVNENTTLKCMLKKTMAKNNRSYVSHKSRIINSPRSHWVSKELTRWNIASRKMSTS